MGIVAGISAIAGVGLSAASTIGGISASSSAAAANQQILADQQKQEALRRQQMELDAKRKSMEVLRNQQRARALALSNATSSGAQFGSGLQGGYGQIAGQTGTDLLNINQNLQFGRQNFDINADITSARMSLASAQSDASFYGALGSLGGTLINSMGPISRLAGGFGSLSPINTGVPGGGYYGTGGAIYPGPGYIPQGYFTR